MIHSYPTLLGMTLLDAGSIEFNLVLRHTIHHFLNIYFLLLCSDSFLLRQVRWRIQADLLT